MKKIDVIISRTFSEHYLFNFFPARGIIATSKTNFVETTLILKQEEQESRQSIEDIRSQEAEWKEGRGRIRSSGRLRTLHGASRGGKCGGTCGEIPHPHPLSSRGLTHSWRGADT